MTEDVEIYGLWEDPILPGVSQAAMTIDARQLAAHWRRCSLSSDFWARYNSLFIPPQTPRGTLSRDTVEYILSYLLNELFENCAKFSSGSQQAVEYQAWVQQDCMVFQLTNHILPEAKAAFLAIIKELLEGDPDLLYFEKLEQNAESDNGGSGLGYLTLIKDYGIRFGFRFIQKAPDRVAVTVQAHVSLKEE